MDYHDMYIQPYKINYFIHSVIYICDKVVSMYANG